jgi:hypothetical protein
MAPAARKCGDQHNNAGGSCGHPLAKGAHAAALNREGSRSYPQWTEFVQPPPIEGLCVATPTEGWLAQPPPIEFKNILYNAAYLSVVQ